MLDAVLFTGDHDPAETAVAEVLTGVVGRPDRAYRRSVTQVNTLDFSHRQIGVQSTRMSAASFFSARAGQSRAAPCLVTG